MATNPHFQSRRISNDGIGYDLNLSGGALVATITACCASGFLLVGYDNGLLGGLITAPEFRTTFNNPDATTVGNLVSLYEIGCCVGALATFYLGDPLGRRRTLLLGCIAMATGAVIQAACSSVAVLVLGRIVCGLGMGTINSTVPVLHAETAPAASRGKLVALDLTVLNLGICIAYWVDYGFTTSSSVTGSVVWRVPVALQCVFLVGLGGTALVIPETPRWLASRGRDQEALAVLERLQQGPRRSIDDVQRAFAEIQAAIQHERATRSRGWTRLVKPNEHGWHDDPIRSRRRLLLACFLQAAQQLSGISALVYYAQPLFSQSIGLNDSASALLSGAVNLCLVLGSTISILLIDRVGRKHLLLPCLAAMSLVMAIQAVLIRTVQQPHPAPLSARAASALLFAFEFLFSLGLQATVWLLPSELLPPPLRTRGSALSTATNWLCNFAVVRLVPTALEHLRWRTYLVFAAVNAGCVPLVAVFVPETKGKTLEQIDAEFRRDASGTVVGNTGRAELVVVDDGDVDVEKPVLVEEQQLDESDFDGEKRSL